MPPTRFTVTSALTVSGTVDAFDDEAVTAELRARVAAAANVDVRSVRLEVLPSSVRLVFIIDADSTSAASVVAQGLTQQLGSAAAASSLLSTPTIGVVSVASVDLAPLIEEVPSPPPLPALPPTLPTAVGVAGGGVAPPLASLTATAMPSAPLTPSLPPLVTAASAEAQQAASQGNLAIIMGCAAAALVALVLIATMAFRAARHSAKVQAIHVHVVTKEQDHEPQAHQLQPSALVSPATPTTRDSMQLVDAVCG